MITNTVYDIQNIEKLLKCHLCLKRFETPKVLRCQHTFCLSCLRNIHKSGTNILICPTCQTSIDVTLEDLNELPINSVVAVLLNVQPMKGKCSLCQKIDTIVICKHCHSTTCYACSEKHLDNMQQKLSDMLEQLENIDPSSIKDKIHELVRQKRNEINEQFENIRVKIHRDSVEKQTELIKHIEQYEKSLLQNIAQDLQQLETTKCELMNNSSNLQSKTEPELIDLYTKACDIQQILKERYLQHVSRVNSIEIVVEYEENNMNDFSKHFQLNIRDGNEILSSNTEEQFFILTLRTNLNQEYKYFVDSHITIYELKEKISKQCNVDQNRIILSKLMDNFDEELDDNRTLGFYKCDATSILRISLRT